jgi:excisionase family DNA binding protein
MAIPPNPSLIDAIQPTSAEAELARESSRRLSPFIDGNLRLRVAGKKGPEIELPAVAVRLLVRVMSEMAAGNAVSLIPIQAELTTQEAADLLGVSRPFLVKQLEEGQIPFRKVGTHRRVLLQDLQAYKEQIDAARLKTLEDLAREGQDLGLGY